MTMRARYEWRTPAWAGPGGVDLIEAEGATPDELRHALVPAQACRVLGRLTFGLSGHRTDLARLRELVEETGDLGHLRWLGERELLALLESEIREQRVLVVPVAAAIPAILPMPEVEERAPAAQDDEPPARAVEAAPPPAAEAAAPELELPLVDVVAQVAVLRQAARLGVPFCEECAKAAAAAAAMGAAA